MLFVVSSASRLSNLTIDERDANFERMCHAGPIGVTKQLIAHIKGRLEHCDLAKTGSRAGYQLRLDVQKRI